MELLLIPLTPQTMPPVVDCCSHCVGQIGAHFPEPSRASLWLQRLLPADGLLAGDDEVSDPIGKSWPIQSGRRPEP